MGRISNVRTGGKTSGSRKDKRKATREAKKERRRVYTQTKSNFQKEAEEERKRAEEARQKAEEIAKKSAKAKRERAEKEKETSRKRPAMLESKTEEELEIEYLERKLGLKSNDGKKKGKSKSRLEKELQDDGFADDIMDFMEVLDAGKSISEYDKLKGVQEDELEVDDEDSDAPMELFRQSNSKGNKGNDEEEDIDEEDYENGDIVSDDAPEDDDDDDDDENAAEESESDGNGQNLGDDRFSDEEEMQNVAYIPKKNLYGSEPSGGAEEAKSERPNSRLFKNSGEQLRIRRFLNRLVNKLTEGNVHQIANEVSSLYSEHPKAILDEQLTSILISAVSNDVIVMAPLATSFAALVAALSILHGNTFGAYVLEKLVLRFDKCLREDSEGITQDGGESVVSKRCANYAVFLSHVYSFGLASSDLIMDMLEKMAFPITEASIDVIVNVVNECGPKLRKDDPARLLRVIQLLQEAQETATSGLSTRMEVLMEEVYALKNNKKRNVVVEDRVKRLVKTLRQISNARGSALLSMNLKWDELLQAEEKGRWWIVGGVWKDQDQSIVRNKEQADIDLEHARRGGGSSISQALARAGSSLLEAARKQRMNTDVRRAIFCEMMTAEDFLAAFDRIMKLNLNARQQREVVYVIMRCVGASKEHNTFFDDLSSHLCTQRPSFKFTFQLAYWDLFKDSESFQLRKLGNLARLLSHLVLQFSLPLTVFKSVDFSSLGDKAVFFFNVFFQVFLCYGGEGKDGARRIAKAINRTGGSGDFKTVSDGIQFFFRHHLIVAGDDGDDEASSAKLLTKRVKIANRILDAISVAHAAEDDPDLQDNFDILNQLNES